MSLIFLLTLHPFLSKALLPSRAYYIQTDQGPNRFFQFSSGPGGQFRKETILSDGTVTGAYSWKDVRGRIRLYTYTADKSGYRGTQHPVKKITDNHEISDNHISSEVVKNDLINNDLYEDEDVRSGR